MRGNRVMKIGFVGLGQMGGPMAMNLADTKVVYLLRPLDLRQCVFGFCAIFR